MPPRPILKSLPEPDITFTSGSPFPFSSSAGLLDSPHVHFPPTPTLTSTGMTHSPFMYDRAPIVVDPNTCALPERGERSYLQLAPHAPTPAELYGQLAKLQLRDCRDRSSEEWDKATGAGDYFNCPLPPTPLPRGMRTTTTRLMTAPPSPTLTSSSSSRRSVCYGYGVSAFPRAPATPGFVTPPTTNPSSPLGLCPDVRGTTTPADADKVVRDDEDTLAERPQANLRVPVVGPVPVSAVRQARLQPPLNQRSSALSYPSPPPSSLASSPQPPPPPPPSLASTGSTSTSNSSSTSSSTTTSDSETGPSFFNTASSSSATLPPSYRAASMPAPPKYDHSVARRGKHHPSRSRSGERCALLRTTNTNTNTTPTTTPTSTTSYDAAVDDCLEGF